MTRGQRIRFMRGYLDAERAMHETQEEIMMLRTKAEHITPTLEGMPHGSGVSDKVGNGAVSIAMLENQLVDEKGRAMIELAKVQGVLFQLKAGSKERELMHKRYIKGMKWEDIANAMHYDVAYVIRLHGNIIDKMKMS